MEIVVVMALAFLMLGVVGSLIVSYSRSYKNSLLQNSGFNHLNSAINMIDSEVNEFAREVKTEGNVINIKYYDDVNKKIRNPKCINCINGKLSIFSNAGTSNDPNTIMNGVKEFVAIKTGKILYIKIVWNNGQNIERSLAIKNAN